MRTGAKLGQHFLKHGWAARALARAVPLQKGEVFLEIGPGKGMLTEELLLSGPVVAIEKDSALIPILQEKFPEQLASRTLRLIEGDVRDIDVEALGLSHYVVAANIPYYITGEIIRSFLSISRQPRAMALLIQKEVAQRIVDTKESLLSLSVKAYGTPRLVEKVSRIHFSPPPSVDSAIISIDNISRHFFDTIREEQFFIVLRAGFAQKRKLVANNLATLFPKEQVTAALVEAHVDAKARAEDITLPQWKVLTERLSTTDSSRG